MFVFFFHFIFLSSSQPNLTDASLINRLVERGVQRLGKDNVDYEEANGQTVRPWAPFLLSLGLTVRWFLKDVSLEVEEESKRSRLRSFLCLSGSQSLSLSFLFFFHIFHSFDSYFLIRSGRWKEMKDMRWTVRFKERWKICLEAVISVYILAASQSFSCSSFSLFNFCYENMSMASNFQDLKKPIFSWPLEIEIKNLSSIGSGITFLSFAMSSRKLWSKRWSVTSRDP